MTPARRATPSTVASRAVSITCVATASTMRCVRARHCTPSATGSSSCRVQWGGGLRGSRTERAASMRVWAGCFSPSLGRGGANLGFFSSSSLHPLRREKNSRISGRRNREIRENRRILYVVASRSPTLGVGARRVLTPAPSGPDRRAGLAWNALIGFGCLGGCSGESPGGIEFVECGIFNDRTATGRSFRASSDVRRLRNVPARAGWTGPRERNRDFSLGVQ